MLEITVVTVVTVVLPNWFESVENDRLSGEGPFGLVSYTGTSCVLWFSKVGCSVPNTWCLFIT